MLCCCSHEVPLSIRMRSCQQIRRVEISTKLQTIMDSKLYALCRNCGLTAMIQRLCASNRSLTLKVLLGCLEHQPFFDAPRHKLPRSRQGRRSFLVPALEGRPRQSNPPNVPGRRVPSRKDKSKQEIFLFIWTTIQLNCHVLKQRTYRKSVTGGVLRSHLVKECLTEFEMGVYSQGEERRQKRQRR